MRHEKHGAARADTNEAPASSAEPFLPAKRDLDSLQHAAKGCRGCPLWEPATQTVFGEGEAHAKLFVIGEQPGDEEDKTGRPFVGPAGKLLDRAFAAAGIDREQVYLTNAVKHFGFQYRGKRRLHSKPFYRSVKACRPWLEAELRAVKPEVIVCLGSTASQSLLGSSFRVMQHRGEVLASEFAKALVATYHPSAILRMPDSDARGEAFDELVADLKTCLKLAAKRR